MSYNRPQAPIPGEPVRDPIPPPYSEVDPAEEYQPKLPPRPPRLPPRSRSKPDIPPRLPKRPQERDANYMDDTLELSLIHI